MKLTYAHLCDLAFLSADGKMNVIGIFDHIGAASFPATHSRCCLVMAMELEGAEADASQKIAVVFVDADGQTLFDIEVKLSASTVSDRPWKVPVPVIVPFSGLVFPAAGSYEFVIRIPGEEPVIVPIECVAFPKAP